MFRHIRTLYQDLLNKQIAVVRWSNRSENDPRSEQYVIAEMENHYPFLRLCENHWKIREVMMLGYPSWKQKRKAKIHAQPMWANKVQLFLLLSRISLLGTHIDQGRGYLFHRDSAASGTAY
jgi:hypothetical protein